MALTLQLPDRFNVAEHFIRPRLEAGDGAQPYLLCGEAVLTVAGLHAHANQAAHAFVRLGLRRGERVALLLRESLEWPALFWGALRAGLLPVPLNPALTGADFRHYLGESRARLLVADAALWPTLAPALEGLRDLRHVALAEDDAPPGRAAAASAAAGAAARAAYGPQLHALDALLGEAPAEFEACSAHPDDPAFWLYTSGSTGAPKAAVHRQRDMVYVAETYLRQVLALRPDDLAFSAAKLYFAYGLGNSLYFPLASRSAAVLAPEPATARGCFELLARHRPSVFHALPWLYHAMLQLHEAWRAGRENPPRELPRLEHLRLAVSGGEPLPPGVLERWQAAFGVPILDGIGSTEALHFYVANRPGAVRAGSTGQAVPGYDLRLVARGGRDAAPGEPGELWVRGGSLLARYWNQPQRTRHALRGGWLASGDRFRRDGDGYYWYEGRLDDLLKVGGSWVNPVEVEHALLAHPAVAECAVVGRADADGLGRALACVVPAPGHAPDAALAEALRAHLAARLAAFKVPQIEFRAALPRTPTGKLRRFLLREGPAAQGGAAPGAS
jgi:benzoate-CoA ligase family protein